MQRIETEPRRLLLQAISLNFRMPPSSGSISGPNYILNTIVADVLEEFADELEKVEDFNTAVHELIRKTYTDHKRIIFDGNGYSRIGCRRRREEG